MPTHISQMKIFDMDNDMRDDIVYLTSAGELGILYGREESKKFDKVILDRSLGLTLDGGSVRE